MRLALALLLLALLELAALVWSLYRLDRRYGHPGGRRHADQWHHGYLGLVAVGIALGMLWPLAPRVVAAVAIFALWAAADDLAQHVRQFTSYLHRSWWHRLYGRHVHRRI